MGIVGRAWFLHDAYCVDTSGAPYASSTQCAQLLTTQVVQLVFLALCMRRVLALVAVPGARPTLKPMGERALFYTHALLAAAAMAVSIPVVVLAFPLHSTAALVLSGTISSAAWFFYSTGLFFQSTRDHSDPVTRSIATAVTVLAFLELLQLPTSHSNRDTSSDHPNVRVVLVLLYTRVALTCTIAFVVAVAFATAPPPSFATSAAAAQRGHISAFDRASWLSRVSYTWISPLITIGQKRRLEMRDVPELPRDDATNTAAQRFQKLLQRELRRPRDDASFLRVLRCLYWRDVAFFALWSALNKLIGLASPLLIKLFLDWAAHEPTPDLSTGYTLALAMVARSLVASVSGTQYALAWKRFDLRVRAGLIAAIYDRTMALSARATQRVGGIGRITNLVSVDVGRLVGMPGTLFDLVLIPLEIVFSLVLLAHEVQYAFVGGVVVLACMLPIQTLLGAKIQAVTTRMLAFRDRRVEITAECVKSMRTIKLLAWTNVFMAKIDAQRRLEMHELSVRKYLDAFCVFFWASTPVIVQTSVFVVVIYTGHELTAANAFTAVSLLDRLIYPMNYFPWIITGFLEARVSALRIRAFLFPRDPSADVFEATALLPPLRTHERDAMALRGEKRNTVEAERCVFVWPTNGSVDAPDAAPTDEEASVALLPETTTAFTLELTKLELTPDRVYVVCGSVGAGKSSLLLALLGEMPQERGRLAVQRPRAAYAPQTPWLFTGTVRDNITMSASGVEFDDVLYQRVLRVCELESDLQSRALYDSAIVSENGSNFSGGQKIRINLARALYQQTKLYLLDDPLSGLDVKTARAVVRNFFRERIFPQGATVVVTTHAIHLVHEFPEDVEMMVMADGEIVEAGRLTDLTRKTSTFQAMLQAATDQDVTGQNVDGTESVEAVGLEATTQQTKRGDGAAVAASDPVKPSMRKDKEDKDGGDEDEHRESGTVDLSVWKRYAEAIGWPLSVAILFAVSVMQLSRNGMDWWIAFYTNSHHSVAPHTFASTLLWITLANCIAVCFRAFLFAFGGLQAARAMYATLIRRIFHASLAFFDATPVGRILNRLSGDTYAVDESLPFILNVFLKDFADVVGTLVVIFYGNKFVLLLLIPLSVVYFRLQASYRPLSRHVQRLESTTQSPILSMFTETLEGLSVIRAMKLQQQYCDTYLHKLNLSQRMSFLGANAGSWFGIRLDLLGVCVTSFVAVFAVFEFQLSGRIHPGVLGLTLTYALPVVGKLNTILGSFVDTERQMIAVERVKEYSDLAPEGRSSSLLSSSNAVPPSWPMSGNVSVTNLSVTYTTTRGSNQTTVEALTDVGCSFQAGEKIGICGRTGAGKSTFLHALFRAVHWQPGSAISIDGVAIDRMPLRLLRSRITYVPQDVVLFAGTVRSNLDPEHKYSDEELWISLRSCSLDVAVARVSARGLDATLGNGDTTFSKGQAQLLCIARALLRRSKVLCIDEATSAIDYETERVVSETLRSQFRDSTVITIAHRLKTIADCDRVLVFDGGRIVESGPPATLLADKASRFHAMASHQDSTPVA